MRVCVCLCPCVLRVPLCASVPPQKHDTRRFRLDLERDLDDRNPPGAVGPVTVEDAVAQRYRAKKGGGAGTIWTTKEKNIGRALVSSHRLTDSECQCRHDLTIDGVLRACLPAARAASLPCVLYLHEKKKVRAVWGLGFRVYVGWTRCLG